MQIKVTEITLLILLSFWKSFPHSWLRCTLPIFTRCHLFLSTQRCCSSNSTLSLLYPFSSLHWTFPSTHKYDVIYPILKINSVLTLFPFQYPIPLSPCQQNCLKDLSVLAEFSNPFPTPTCVRSIQEASTLLNRILVASMLLNRVVSSQRPSSLPHQQRLAQRILIKVVLHQAFRTAHSPGFLPASLVTPSESVSWFLIISFTLLTLEYCWLSTWAASLFRLHPLP